IVLIAFINFVNLSTALAIYRSKEIGARKALGGSRSQIFWQFITETSLVVSCALVLVVLGILVGLPTLNSWIQSQLDLQLLANPSVMISLLFFILLVVFMAGSYPAVVMSGFNPIRALQNQISAKEIGGYRLRQILSFIQFTVAQAVIIGAVVALYQLDYFQQQDLGFNQKAIITTKVPRNDYSRLASFRNQLKQQSDIRYVSFHQSPPITSTNEGSYVRFNHRDSFEPFLVRDRWADEEYLKTYDLQLLAGRNIILRDSTAEFLVNEKFVAALGTSPDEVLGKHFFESSTETEGTIVGVVKDFHHRSLQHPIEPVVIYPYPRIFTQAGIQIQSENISQTLQKIKTTWEATFPNQVFTYQFLEDSIQQLYQEEQRIARLIRLFTIVSILICSLGMVGLAMYTAQQRTKEIGIRKILGASAGSIALLLSKSFIQLLFVSFIVAVAIANYALQDWLADFAYRVSIAWWMFAASGLIMLFIAILSIGSQTLKAIRQNPVDSLRND
ncbi:MAG: FtsX-like permease family protein, partial [Tunicatimonas sp.]|uniref:FtsX-like permease family protein n=1 Tax=Tunicatimonas sp. TaxID=1940096 RepID=UPI003C7674D1